MAFCETIERNYQQCCNAERFILGTETSLKALPIKELLDRLVSENELQLFNEIQNDFKNLPPL